jgi:Tol biopolymer transport system component
MRTNHDRITRRESLTRLAAGGAARAWASKGRGEEDKERPPARIYVATVGGAGEFRPEVSGILAIDPKDGTWSQVAPEGFTSVRVARDGRRMLGVKSRPREDWGIYLLETRGGEPPRRIVDGPNPLFLWSPDGKQVVFREARPDGTTKTWRMDPDGTGRVEVPIPATDAVADWSPDGRWLVTGSSRPLGDGSRPKPFKTPAYLVHPDGTGERLLLGAEVGSRLHRFSPDGKTIVYSCIETDGRGPLRGKFRIEAIGVDGQDRRTLLNHEGNEGPFMAA